MKESDAGVVAQLLSSYRGDPRGQYVGRRYIPSQQATAEILKILLEIFFPGYFGRRDLTDQNLESHLRERLSDLTQKLSDQIECCLCHDQELTSLKADTSMCEGRAGAITETFVGRLSVLRGQILMDVQAAYDGDPAAGSLHEVILAYPGLLAVTVYRVAHELYRMGVPLLPRMMSEWAHTQTGADIHPGAEIGDSFFIDHATGCVIGETTHIGHRVKLYQGVTLGALSIPKDAGGRVVRGSKRHPTVEDGVTIYANATVLGGKTVLGAGSVLGGSVFLTETINPGTRVALDPPKLRVASSSGPQPGDVDFEI